MFVNSPDLVCDSRCKVCTGPTNKECSYCATGNVLDLETKTCDSTCPDGKSKNVHSDYSEHPVCI